MYQENKKEKDEHKNPDTTSGEENSTNQDEKGEKPDDPENPDWLRCKDIGFGNKERLTQDENTFWNDFIEKYLKPLEGNEKQEKEVKQVMISKCAGCVRYFNISGIFLVAVISKIEVPMVVRNSKGP